MSKPQKLSILLNNNLLEVMLDEEFDGDELKKLRGKAIFAGDNGFETLIVTEVLDTDIEAIEAEINLGIDYYVNEHSALYGMTYGMHHYDGEDKFLGQAESNELFDKKSYEAYSVLVHGVREPFDTNTAEEYISSHGFGDATPEGLGMAEELYEEGLYYSDIGHEIVAQGLTSESECDIEPVR